MDTYWAWEYGTGDKKNAIELVRAADAQRALDAAQELSAAWAEKARQYELELEGDPQNLHGQGRTFGLRSQLATLQAQADHTRIERNRLWGELADLQAQLADRDAMILQMGKQAARLAKENMAVKAQLRQVEGERDAWAEKAREYELELDGDPQNFHGKGRSFGLRGDLTTLRQLVEALPVLDMRFDSVAVGPLGWTVGGVTFGKVTEANAYSALLQYRATLAAKDAGKETDNGL